MTRHLTLLLLFAALTALLLPPARAQDPAALRFVEQVFARLPQDPVEDYRFVSWQTPGRPTAEGFGLKPVAELDPDKLIAAVLDVDGYTKNIKYVAECRRIADPRFSAPGVLRFYQRVEVPVLGALHHELVLNDGGTRDGYRYAWWSFLEQETAALDPDVGMRSAYSYGAWIAGEGLVGYALSNAPVREDAGLKWYPLTDGADWTAKGVIEDNIDAMAAWAKRR